MKSNLEGVSKAKKEGLFYARARCSHILNKKRENPSQSGESLKVVEPRLPNHAFPEKLKYFL